MFEFLSHLTDDLHPALNHFPIALLTVSFLLSFAARRWTGLRATEWFTFCWGAIMAVPTAITGLIAHEPFEELPVHATIEQHGLPANIGTLFMVAMVIWRYRSRRKGNDVGERSWYLAFAVIGLIWIFIVGGTGGSLTYNYGINVRGTTPLP